MRYRAPYVSILKTKIADPYRKAKATVWGSRLGPNVAVARGHSRERPPLLLCGLEVLALFYFCDAYPKWKGYLRRAKYKSLQDILVSEVKSHPFEWVTLGGEKGGTPPTLALIPSKHQIVTGDRRHTFHSRP